ncbi:hypothetical protein, partial [Escherichia coli]|uniref:hypothetical protein n=1 Tax=Escherichia coli TaxID=562 RepID=UPI001BDCB4CC
LDLSLRSPESLSNALFDVTMRKTMRNRKNRSECDTAHFRGYLQNSRCLEEILIKIELLSGSWQQITATRPLKSVERR